MAPSKDLAASAVVSAAKRSFGKGSDPRIASIVKEAEIRAVVGPGNASVWPKEQDAPV